MSNAAHPSPPQTIGLTLQVYVPAEDAPAARAYYADLFGRPPMFTPHDDFFEWPPVPGNECWIQIAAHPEPAPLTNRVRFAVADLALAVRFLDDRDIPHTRPSQLPGVVAFLDFADPWENRLGYYQDLVSSGQQREYPGTSVNDSSQFADFGEP